MTVNMQEIYELFINNIISINNHELDRHDIDSVLYCQLFYGDILISFKTVGFFSVVSTTKLSIKIVNMSTFTTISDDMLDINDNSNETIIKMIQYIEKKGLNIKYDLDILK